MDGNRRSDIKPGLRVSIVLKKDQRTGKLTEGIVKDILTGLSSQNFEVYTDRGDALRKALSGLKKNDVLVVLGKGRETYQEVEGVRLPYSDIEIIEEFCENSNS